MTPDSGDQKNGSKAVSAWRHIGHSDRDGFTASRSDRLPSIPGGHFKRY
jgi:hypothetical protein